MFALSALTLLVVHQEEHPACKNECSGVGVVSLKSRLVYSVWCQFTQFVPEKRLLNRCLSFAFVMVAL